MQQKQDNVLEPFFNTPKHWHFEDIKKHANISRPQLAQWLKILEKENLIKRIKPKGHMPYYIGNVGNPSFHNRKKLFAKQQLQQSGLLDHLASLEKAKVVILFGSFSRWDWYDDSDIDIFIYGDGDDFEHGKYESKIKREIQVHHAKNTKDLQRIDKLLLRIVSGDFIKGSIQDLGIEIHAKT
jgi:predicted nucleotidyltransferase